MNYGVEKKGFTIKDIFIQIVVIALFVFLLAWLFPTRVSFNGLNKKIDILTGTMYGNNIQTMKEAAISYYTNERLPQALNDVERITLKDMLNLHLLVDFVDGNGNSCSKTDSYVEVIKLRDEYQMKINLSCTDNDAYIIVHLGCYDYCNGLGICAKEEEIVVTPNRELSCEYEYEKIINPVWGDYGAWSEWSTNKVTSSDYRQVESKTEVALTGTRQVQVGSRVETKEVTKLETKYCADGSNPVNGQCVTGSTTSTDAICPDGYSYNPSNGMCTGYVTKSFDPSCPSGSGWTRNGNTCTRGTTSYAYANPECPQGYSFEGGTCYGPTTPVSYTKGAYIGTYTGYSVPSTNANTYYETVSSDYVYDCNNSCAFRWVYTYKAYKTVVTGGTRPTATPTCPNGYAPTGSTCVKAVSSPETAQAICSRGTLQNGKCVYNDTDTVGVTCPQGYNLSGGRCYAGTTNYTPALVSVSTSCTGDYTLNGDVCTRTVPVYENQDIYENVTYYRFRTRTYASGDRKIKWSKSQNDQALLRDGYSLTGNKKCN